MIDMTAIILTKNEELNIERCIRSINNIAKRVIVVDSNSTDNTLEIAKNMGADIYTHQWKHYADQFNWALDNTHIDSKWIFRIDADEFVNEALEREIISKCCEHNQDEINGFVLKFKIYFLGRFLLHGGAYPIYNLAVFKTGKGRYENRAMGEHVILNSGKSIILKNDCIHFDYKDLSSWIDKHNKYATREVMDYSAMQDCDREQAVLYDKAERVKKIRDNMYYKLPKFLRARLYYWYRYYLQLGFLDGRPGKIYAFLQAYWYRYLVDAKIVEKEIAK
jgi:glycosyltransferase involved in cell wall biosynthesis